MNIPEKIFYEVSSVCASADYAGEKICTIYLSEDETCSLILSGEGEMKVCAFHYFRGHDRQQKWTVFCLGGGGESLTIRFVNMDNAANDGSRHVLGFVVDVLREITGTVSFPKEIEEYLHV